MNHHQPMPLQPSTPHSLFAELAPLLDSGELDAERAAWAWNHLETCADCQRLYAGYQVSAEALRRHYRSVRARASADVRAPVPLFSAEDIMRIADMDAIHEDLPPRADWPNAPRDPRPPRSGWARARVPLATALTVAVVLAVIGTLFTLRGHTGAGSGSNSNATATLGPTATPRSSASDIIVEIPIGANHPSLASPAQVVAAPDGSVWILDPDTNTIGHYSANGQVQTYSPSKPNANLYSLTLASDGAVWFIEHDYNLVGRISPSGKVSEFPLPNPVRFDSPQLNTPAFSMTAGANGSVWFTACSYSCLVPMQSNGAVGTVLMWSMPNPQLRGLATAPNGKIWVTEAGDGYVDLLDPVVYQTDPRNALTRYKLNHAGAQPTSIAVASDNSAWYVDEITDTIGRILPNGQNQEITPPRGQQAFGGVTDLAVAPDGSVWFTEINNNRITRLNADVLFPEYDIPTPAAGAATLSIAPNGYVWFNEYHAGKIGYIIP